MKASKLIEKLEECVRVSGDLDVRLYTDHGQCSMSAEWVGISYIEDTSYMADTIHPDDLDGCDNPIKIIEIQA